MPDWEKTVMKRTEINKILKEKGSYIPAYADYGTEHPTYKELLAQAKISYKAGYEQALKDYNIDTTTSGVVQ